MSKKSKKEDLVPLDRIPGRRSTASTKPKYDPDAHLIRRDKDEEELRGLLIDLIKTEINKIFKK